MRITYVCNEYPPRPHGGIGTFVHMIAHAMWQKGHGVTVVGLGQPEGVTFDGGITVVTLPSHRAPVVGPLASRIGLYRWLSAKASRGEVDVIEVPDYMGMLPAGIRDCAVVVRLHQSCTAIHAQAGKRIPRGVLLYERRTLRANRNWIGVSRFVLDLTKSTFRTTPKCSTVIYNPIGSVDVGLPRLPGLPAHYVLFVGHVSRQKGAVMLARAATAFMCSRPDLHLVYVGGILNAKGEDILREIHGILGDELSRRAHFLGHLDRASVLRCMTHAAALVLPSTLEAFGIVVLEAMACKTPTVYSRTGPGPEVIRDGVDGFLANPDDPQDFAMKISMLLSNPELASSMTRNAREMVEGRFSLKTCIAASEDFYRRCLEDRRAF